MDDDDEKTEEEDGGEGTEEEQKDTYVTDKGDPDWTPEEAEHAYQQAGDDNSDQKPDPRYETT